MINKALLLEKLERANMTKLDLADELEISRSSLYRRLAGDTVFTHREVRACETLLNLSHTESAAIFNNM